MPKKETRELRLTLTIGEGALFQTYKNGEKDYVQHFTDNRKAMELVIALLHHAINIGDAATTFFRPIN